MKTLINVDRLTWSKVKQYATVKNCSLSLAVELLLTHALGCEKRNVEKEDFNN